MYSEVVTNLRLKGLRPVLEEWVNMVGNYCKTQADSPWWYNERTTLSILAGAAWRKNWFALEEYSTKKRGKTSSKLDHTVSDSNGRCDLYLANSSSSYAIEAKQAWQGITKKSLYTKYHSAIDSAFFDAGNLHSREAWYRLGVVFTVPYFKYKDDTPSINMVEEKWIEFLEGLSLPDQDLGAYAWFRLRNCDNSCNDKKKLAFPGVIMSVIERKKGNKSS